MSLSASNPDKRLLAEWLRDKADLLEKAEPFYEDEDFRAESVEEVRMFRAIAEVLDRCA
jgi:hypothetical protein